MKQIWRFTFMWWQTRVVSHPLPQSRRGQPATNVTVPTWRRLLRRGELPDVASLGDNSENLRARRDIFKTLDISHEGPGK